MWWSRRDILALAAAVTVAGCGFAPVYGPGGSGAALDGAVTVVTPDTVDGFTLRQRLQDRLGPANAPRYTLTVTLDTREERVGVTRDQDTTRFNVLGRARFTLTDTAGNRLDGGTIDSFTSYAATGTPLATRASRQDSYRRLMTILADGITDQLLIAPPPGVEEAPA